MIYFDGFWPVPAWFPGDFEPFGVFKEPALAWPPAGWTDGVVRRCRPAALGGEAALLQRRVGGQPTVARALLRVRHRGAMKLGV